MQQGSRILVPIDFSTGSDRAVDLAVMLARSLGGSIELLHVHDLPGAASTIVPGADIERDAAANLASAERRLTEVRDWLAIQGFAAVSTRAEAGDPVDVILELCEHGGYGFVVMGTHGRTGIARLLESSVAERIVRSARCPVLTVHLPPEEG